MRVRGLELEGHTFRVPLDHTRGGVAGEIELFAREVRRPGAAAKDLPWLVFLQGGPGFESPRPLSAEGWIGRATQDHRVLLVDQRGTGRSTAQQPQNLGAIGDADAQAEHLALFRADSIVRDLELVRREMGVERWSLLGQSFGGFCCVHYLSVAPESLSGVMITGGLPGLETHADDVYLRTYALCAEKNEALLRDAPNVGRRLRAVFERVLEGGVTLPTGDALTAERLQVIGLQLGVGTGAARIHYLLEDAFVPGTRELSARFLHGLGEMFPFEANPLYAVLHESCYGQGAATRWSAERIRDDFPRFDARAALENGDVPYLTGEMVYPWFFRQSRALEPLAGVAERLALRGDWPRLYDPAVLERNEVPVAAVIYADDMFVPADLSRITASRIRGLRPWVTNEYEHDGLRADGARIFARLSEDLRLWRS